MKIKNYLLGLSAVAIILTAASFIYKDYHKVKYAPANYEGMAQYLGFADGAMEHYRMMRADKNGEILFKDVINSRNAVRNFDAQKNSASGVYWSNLGPNYVGGRARALLQDNTTANSATWYAGGVSGGVFITYDGGNQWYEYNSNITSLAISSFAQTSDGVLFVATGHSEEGGQGGDESSGIPGDGLFRRAVDGQGNHTFERIVGPALPNSNASADWRRIDRIASHPSNPDRLYVGMNKGLRITSNARAAVGEVEFFTPAGLPLGNVQDIVVNSDGSEFFVVSGAIIVHYSDKGGSDITEIKRFTIPGGVGGMSRACLAIAPSDDNVIYAAIAASNSCLYGIYQSRDKGTTWTNIGPGGTSFDPYANPGVNCQGNYDNSIAVFPDDAGRIIVGGVQLWEWNESPTNPGTGGWTQIAVTQSPGRSLFDTNYVHADKHRIRIPKSNEIWIASDGGIGKSIDGGATWSQINNGFNVTQFYAIDAAVGIPFEFNGQEYILEQVVGGTQDNGTQLVGTNPATPIDGQDISGGDGFDTYFSNLAGQAFTSYVYNLSINRVSFNNPQGQLLWDAELTALCNDAFPPGNNACGPFHTKMGYWETASASETQDSIKVYVKTNVAVGDSLTYFSAIGQELELRWPSPKALSSGDSIMMPDFAQSRLVIATDIGIFMTRDAAKLGTNNFKWDLITGAAPRPSSLIGSVSDMKFSKDGNQLFVATPGGSLYRIDNLSQGGDSLTLDIRSGQSVVTCTRIGAIDGPGIANRIAIDPNDPNNIVLTSGGYASGDHVFYATNCATATIANPATVVPIQGDLPQMPVYSAVIADHDANTVLIGTEFAVYMTEMVAGASTKWEYAGNGMPKVPVYFMLQQSNLYPLGVASGIENANYRKIYLGTFGRGFYVTDNLVGIDEKQGDQIATARSHFELSIYPNPVSDRLNIALDLNEDQNLVVEVFDLNGKVVATLKNGQVNRGTQKMEMDVTGLRNGTYLVSARSTEERKVAKMVVLR
ncbi:MAG: T9SS type A sorting domain-containing protein [Vicingaceae bacterium]